MNWNELETEKKQVRQQLEEKETLKQWFLKQQEELEDIYLAEEQQNKRLLELFPTGSLQLFFQDTYEENRRCQTTAFSTFEELEKEIRRQQRDLEEHERELLIEEHKLLDREQEGLQNG